MATARRRTTSRSKRNRGKRWSGRVTRSSNALDLRQAVFKRRDPKGIARSLKRSAEHSTRRKGSAYQSAMSMLNFYVNRAGRNLPATQKRKLQRAKTDLRKLYKRG